MTMKKSLLTSLIVTLSFFFLFSENEKKWEKEEEVDPNINAVYYNGLKVPVKVLALVNGYCKETNMVRKFNKSVSKINKIGYQINYQLNKSPKSTRYFKNKKIKFNNSGWHYPDHHSMGFQCEIIKMERNFYDKYSVKPNSLVRGVKFSSIVVKNHQVLVG